MPGEVGLDDGRYLSRDPERVIVVGARKAGAARRRAGRRRRPPIAEPGSAPGEVSFTRLTVVRPEPLGSADAATAWLAEVRANADRADAEVAEAIPVLNRALHAHRTAALDPYAADLSARHALVVRIGFGDGEGLADGSWREAIEVSPDRGRARRADAMRPQERVAAVLAEREAVDVCELLLLRARADADAGRRREAALQLRVGLDAMLAEVSAEPDSDQAADLERLQERQPLAAAAADEALRGDLARERDEEVTETLRLCERVLRRRRLRG